MELRDLTPLALPLAIFFNNRSPDSPSPAPSPSTIESPSTENSRRHQITCSVTSPEDVKVAENQDVIAGQILCDRTEARAALEAKKKQLELTLAQSPVTIAPSVGLQMPPPDFSVEEAAIKQAEAELARIESLPEIQFVHTAIDGGYFRQVGEPDRWQQYLDRQQQIGDARYRVSSAIANLNTAKAKRQQEEFLWMSQQASQSQQLVLEQARSQQQAAYQKAMLTSDLQELEEKLETLTSVKSPYNGRIRKVKILGQSDRTLSVEITLVANEIANSPIPR